VKFLFAFKKLKTYFCNRFEREAKKDRQKRGEKELRKNFKKVSNKALKSGLKKSIFALAPQEGRTKKDGKISQDIWKIQTSFSKG